jgi:hypothetical protein
VFVYIATMNDFKDLIGTKRPNLSPNSITTYNSILRNLYKNVFGDDQMDASKFDDTKSVLDYLRDLTPSKRKTVLSSLVIITDNPKYRDLMMNDIRDYSHEIAKQEKTPAQKESWVEMDDIKRKWEMLKRNTDLLYKKLHLTTNDLQDIQSFVMLSLLGGMFIPPRRALDYVQFKIRDINKEKDNYLEKASLIFNTYKTSRTYGRQKVGIPPTLKYLLNKWIKKNPTDYLFFDTNMNPLTSVKLNQRLNKLFGGKKVGVNSLRHTYLTDKYAETIKTNRDLSNDMASMGSSMNMANTYIKSNE